MDPRRRAEWSAGYRAVVVNLCLACSEARALGVENHVCEVQLTLAAMMPHRSAIASSFRSFPPPPSSSPPPPPPASASGVAEGGTSATTKTAAAVACEPMLTAAEAAEADLQQSGWEWPGGLDDNCRDGSGCNITTSPAADGNSGESRTLHDHDNDDDGNEMQKADWHEDYIRFRNIREHCIPRPSDPSSSYIVATSASAVNAADIAAATPAAASAAKCAGLLSSGDPPSAPLLRQLLMPPAEETANADSEMSGSHDGYASAEPAFVSRATLPPAAAADVAFAAPSLNVEVPLNRPNPGCGCGGDERNGETVGRSEGVGRLAAMHARTTITDPLCPAPAQAGAAADGLLRREPNELEGNSRRGSRVKPAVVLGPGTEDAGVVRLDVVLRSAFLASALVPRDARRREAAALLREAFDHSHAGSAMFTSNPIAAGSSKRTFHAIMACFCGYFAYRTYTSAVPLPHAGRIPTSRMCMSFAAARDSALPPAAARVAAFGPLVDGCAWPQIPWSAFQSATLSPTMPSANFSFSEVGDVNGEAGKRCADMGREVMVHGFWFDTDASSESTARDPMRWIVRAWHSVAANNNGADGGGGENASNASAARGSGGEWSVVGASEWRMAGDGSLEFFPNLAFPTPAAPRGARVRVDLRPPWPWVVDWPAFEAITASGVAVALVSAVLGFRSAVSRWLAGCFAAGSLSFVAAAGGYHTMGRGRAAATCWLEAVANAVYVAGFSRYQSHLVRVLAACGAATLASLLADGVAVYGQPWGETAADMVLSAGTAAIAFAVVIAVLRRYVLLRSARTVRSDQARYDEAWAGVLAVDSVEGGGDGGVAAVNEEARRLQEAAREEHARQLRRRYLPLRAALRAANSPPNVNPTTTYRATSDTLMEEALELGIASRRLCPVDSQRPRTGEESSLSTSAAKVRVAHRHFSSAMAVVARAARCRAWLHLCSCGAKDKGGCGCDSGGSSTRPLTAQLDMRRHVADRLDPLAPVENLQQLFHQASAVHPLLLGKVCDWATEAAAAGVGEVWVLGGKGAKVKSLTRAVEKTYRAYREDVSRLLDLCRQSLVASTPAAAARCLAALRADAEAQPVRVKNRMDPAYDAALSAGYRDVVVNLRLVGPEARRLGLETHVCEVQVLLEAFARLKNDEGHKRYVAFRNLRGE